MRVEVAESNADAARAWDGPTGAAWVERADAYDRGVAAYLPALLAAAGPTPVAALLDVGCGSGAVARTMARRVGRVTAIDLSAAQLALGRARAERAGLAKKIEFRQADAQVAELGEAVYDRVLSRNGVQFFGDPVAAFANLARALRPGGKLVLQVWQGYAEQEWLPSFRAAVGAPPLGAVGPFALGDPERVRELLGAAGFAEPQLTGLREPMWFGADVAEAEAMAVGLVGGLVEQLDDPERALERLRADLRAHLGEEGVTYGSAMWLITTTPR